MSRKVLIISFSFEQEKEAFEVLEQTGFEPMLLAQNDRQGFTEGDFINYWNNLLDKPEGLLMGADIPLGEQFASRAEGLKGISLNCAGYDHLELAAFSKRNIPICNVPRQNFDAVADLIFGLILSVMRKIPESDQNIRQGKWCDGVERGYAVSQKTIGIIGFGAIGQAVAKRALGFDMKVIVSSTSQKPELSKQYQAEYVDRKTLFETADIIVPTCPLNEDTYHMIDGKILEMMKKDAFVVNASRGGIIDSEALFAALKNKKIAGAALDVFEEEPLYKSELFELENIVVTPHIGGLADREIHNVAMQAAYNMVDLLNGKQLKTIIGEE